MDYFTVDGIEITLDKEGSREFAKVSYPIRYGRYAEMRAHGHLFQLNLNAEIKFIRGSREHWPDPTEWLKRTQGNDWVYYSAGDYKGVFELTGEYYFPCLSYPSNSIFPENPFEKKAVKSAIRFWWRLCKNLDGLYGGKAPPRLRDFLCRASKNDERALESRARALWKIIGTRVTVLPPDCRHVDYEIIPLIIADGCLYRCGFCTVKSGKELSLRRRQQIEEQIRDLKRFYGPDLPNYNSIFLGNHDALGSGRDLIEFATAKAYQIFEIERSYLKNPKIFIFGSVDSFLGASESLIEYLERQPFYTYINIGLESGDPATLCTLEKPVDVTKIRDAFAKMIEINRSYENLEVTANFLFGPELSAYHLQSLIDLVSSFRNRLPRKGCLYLSPLLRGNSKKERSRDLIRRFKQLKAESPLNMYLYLIQRL